MNFNTFLYLFGFLPVALLGYFALARLGMPRAAKTFLCLSSLVFCGWQAPWQSVVLLGSLVLTLALSAALGSARSPGTRKTLFLLGVAAHLGLLGFFKYADFLLDTLGLPPGAGGAVAQMGLPLGLSFYTFIQIRLLAWRRATADQGLPDRAGLLDQAQSVAFFPQLASGPIVRPEETLPQFLSSKGLGFNPRNLAAGLFLLAIGLAKKSLLADPLAVWVADGFDTARSLGCLEAWLASLGYTLQLAFDFGGYMDMALGAALLFNIRLPANFHSPYRAVSIQDFWRRWHITLGSFLRDFVYIPLGGSRGPQARTLANLLVTFLLCGAWHGAGWTFVLWGGLHGLAMCLHRLWAQLARPLPRLLAVVLTFGFVNTAWVVFRAASFADALKVLRGMYLSWGMPVAGLGWSQLAGPTAAFGQLTASYRLLLLLAVALACAFSRHNSLSLLERLRPGPAHALLTTGLLLASLLSMGKASGFLYANF